MTETRMPHPHHEEHLCFLHSTGLLKSNLDEYKKLVKNAMYVCRNCGRLAAEEKNLCAAEKL
jgi:hypothetical protein